MKSELRICWVSWPVLLRALLEDPVYPWALETASQRYHSHGEGRPTRFLEKSLNLAIETVVRQRNHDTELELCILLGHGQNKRRS